MRTAEYNEVMEQFLVNEGVSYSTPEEKEEEIV